jgi:sugar lactone lactonase YvrE
MRETIQESRAGESVMLVERVQSGARTAQTTGRRSVQRGRWVPAAIALWALSTLGCGADHPIVMDCTDRAGIHAICGFQNPEDLALLADGKTLIVSQFGMMDGSVPGSLALLDLETEGISEIFAAHRDVAAPAPATADSLFGEADCPGPPNPDFSPHGLDLAALPDGTLRLLVVNHGGRESIEFFEVQEAASSTKIHWRGCAIPPPGSYMNDVVSLPDGGLLVTHMLDRDSQTFEMIRASLGFDTGFVYEWQPVSGFKKVPGTDAPFPNGIELSADGREIYVNIYSGSEVRRIDRETGEILARVSVPSPDNISWSRDGRLLVASHHGGIRDQMACYGLEEGTCPMAFAIMALDPTTLEAVEVFRNAGAPRGAGPVAIDVGDELVIGSFASDRVIRVKQQN